MSSRLSLLCDRFSPDVLENGITAACAQYDILLIAYSPIGRGMLTGQFKKFEDITENSLLTHFNFPRFQKGSLEQNGHMVEKVEDLATKKGYTTAQLAINWTRALSKQPGMPTIIPIPGASTAARVEENSKLVDFTDDEMAQIDAILASFAPAGEGYHAFMETNT